MQTLSIMRFRFAFATLCCMIVAGCAHSGSRVESPVPPSAQQNAASCNPTNDTNRDIVVAFYEEGLVGLQPRRAFERYVSPDFVEHWDVVAEPPEQQLNPNPRF